MATKKPIKKTTKSTTTRRPVKATTKTRRTTKTTTKRTTPTKSATKRTTKPVSRRTTKPVTKRTIRPTPKRVATRRVSTSKKATPKLNRQGILITILGVTMAIFLGIFILPNVLKTFTKDKPVLGYRVSIPSNATIPHSSFKDKNFYACVVGNLNNSKINNKTNRTFSHKATDAELKALTLLTCHNSYNTPESLKINSTVGLEKIPNLRQLNLIYNNLSSIDLTNQKKLISLDLHLNNLSSINLSNQKELRNLSLGSNKLSSINLTNQKELAWLYLDSNNLSSINLANQTKLTSLSLSSNNLSSINLTSLGSLSSAFLNNNPFAPSKVRMLTSNYAYSGDYINVNTLNRETILNNIYPFASKIKINKYIVTASGSKVTSGTYKNGDKVIVEALGIKEERPIAVTSNSGKITSVKWVDHTDGRAVKARLKFKSDQNQDWYNLVCYTTDGKTVLENINLANTLKSDGYRYSNSTYIINNRKCYLAGVVWSNGKNVWGASTLIK